MTSTNRTELLASLDPNQWTNASQTFKNTVLHNTRALEGIEETLRAKLMSGSKAAIQAIYDPTLSTADHYRGLAVVIDATRDAVAANP
ncbi:MAG: hypothetical protein LBH96_04460 [Candidatus Peribacteria bacterium]|jgi:hypothetical protein|nr:hypothetical protein [Candidatus Peribacteria bacterium]